MKQGFKELPLEVKADSAIQLFLNEYLGQDYKCGVSSSMHLLLRNIHFLIGHNAFNIGENKQGGKSGRGNHC